MSKLIAAIDNSAAARPVLATAAALAHPLQAELEAVHVRENGGSTASAAGVPLRTLEPPALASLLDVAKQADVQAVVVGTRASPAGPSPVGHVALALIGALLGAAAAKLEDRWFPHHFGLRFSGNQHDENTCKRVDFPANSGGATLLRVQRDRMTCFLGTESARPAKSAPFRRFTAGSLT